MAQIDISAVANLQQDQWMDIFVRGENTEHVMVDWATRHEKSSVVGDTFRFPNYSMGAATKPADDNTATTYDSITAGTPVDATFYEIVKAVDLTALGAAGSPIKSTDQLIDLMLRKIKDQLEADLLAAGLGTSNVSTATATPVAALTAALVGGARGDFQYPRTVKGVLVPQDGYNDLLADSDLTNAANLGGTSVVREGAVGRLFGVDVIYHPEMADGKSLMVADGSVQYCVGGFNTFQLRDPDTRSEKLALQMIVAVALTEQGEDAKCLILDHSA